MSLLNPFVLRVNGLSGLSKKPFQPSGKPILSHRGCEVFKAHSSLFQFAKDGVIFSERAGASKAKEVIDEFLDETDQESLASWEQEVWRTGREYLSGKEVSA